ncbi:hypothetical protein HDU76_012320, partial [Blyttiomyces sp. JEL0837]
MTQAFSKPSMTNTASGIKTPRWTSPASFLPLKSFVFFYLQTVCVFLVASILMAEVEAAAAITTNLKGCVADGQYDANTDYFPEKVNLTNTAYLAYTYDKNFKTITNKINNETIVLYQCGTPKPTNIPAKAQVIAVPITNVSIGDTTIVTYLELLGLRTTIKFAEDGTESYISSPCVQAEKGTANEIKAIDTTNATKAAEQLASVNVAFEYSANVTKVPN